MAELVITDEALADLDEAWDYLSRRNLQAADRLVDRFFASAKIHAQFPLSGQSREEISPGLRCFVVSPYVAFYRARGDAVAIIRVLHGRRDVKRILGGKDSSP